MPFGAVFGSLTLFLVLSFLLPGIIILLSGIVLFPNEATMLLSGEILSLNVSDTSGIDPWIGTGVFLVVAYLQYPFAVIAEVEGFDKVWEKIFSGRDFAGKLEFAEKRPEIIAKAEAYSMNYAHCDQVFGEFILCYNTGFWIGLLSLARLIMSVVLPINFSFWAALVLLSIAGASLFYVAPLFKMRYLNALASLEAATRKKERQKLW